jgi:hypothetical protein
MAYTSHGHHIDGTSKNNEPKNKFRCGGPSLCADCSKQAVIAVMTGISIEPEILLGDNQANYQTKAMNIVKDYLISRSEDEPYDIYVVWFSKTLQNWKALVATTRADDMYYEVTYNGDKKETYLDAYMKVHNRVILD